VCEHAKACEGQSGEGSTKGMKVTEADSLVLEPAHMKGGEAASSPAQNQERGTKANSPDSYAFVKQKKR
jgi:hypothetical protein